MGVSGREFDALKRSNLTAEVTHRNEFNEISGIEITIQGIRGGSGPEALSRVWYRVFLDVENIRSDQIPEAWVLAPPTALANHRFVTSLHYCPKHEQNLPWICLGHAYQGDSYFTFWKELEKHNRTLFALIKCVETLLKQLQ